MRGRLVLVSLLFAYACGRAGIGAIGNDDDELVGLHPDMFPSPTPTPILPAAPGDLVLNEVFPTIQPGCMAPDCDANRNGSVDTGADQFVEIVNVADGPRSLAGIGIHEADGSPDAPRFTFGSDVVLAPNGAAIVFGDFQGSVPLPAHFNSALVFEVSGGADLDFSYPSKSDFCELRRAGQVLATMSWGSAAAAPIANRSLTLTPELEPGVYTAHPTAVHDGGTRNSSPGWRSTYTPF